MAFLDNLKQRLTSDADSASPLAQFLNTKGDSTMENYIANTATARRKAAVDKNLCRVGGLSLTFINTISK